MKGKKKGWEEEKYQGKEEGSLSPPHNENQKGIFVSLHQLPSLK